MTENLLYLKGGVLIIGSLLWQDYLNKQGDDIRKTWRSEHLLTDNKNMVKAPIRYGRYSDNSKVFTMTFSKTVTKNKFETAYFVPLSKPFITTIEELFKEATALSNAEGMNGNFANSWASLGILFNENRIDKKLKAKLTAFWKQKIKNKPIQVLSKHSH